MKRKFLALSLCAVIGISAFALCACTPQIKNFEIFVTSSNTTQGGTAYGTGSYKEDSIVKLNAVPKNNNTFLAWVKNEDEIISYEKEYSFVASAKTEGKYTALFSTAEYDFAKLSTVSYGISSFKLENSDFSATITNFELSCNTIADLYKPLATFENADLKNDDDNDFESEIELKNKVFYFDKTYHFQLQINFQYTTDTGEIENEPLISKFTINFNDLFGQLAVTSGNTIRLFNEYKNINEKTVLTTELVLNKSTVDDSFSLNLNVKPLINSNYWDNSVGVIKYNVQQLSLSFCYPFSDLNK